MAKNYFSIKNRTDIKYVELLHCLVIMTKYGFKTARGIQSWLIDFAERIKVEN